jgi:hypothetical protein
MLKPVQFALQTSSHLLTNQLHEAKFSWEANIHLSGQEIPALMQSEGSLSCSQQLSVAGYLEPDVNSPHSEPSPWKLQ